MMQQDTLSAPLLISLLALTGTLEIQAHGLNLQIFIHTNTTYSHK